MHTLDLQTSEDTEEGWNTSAVMNKNEINLESIMTTECIIHTYYLIYVQDFKDTSWNQKEVGITIKKQSSSIAVH